MNQPSNDLVWDPKNQVIYLSVPSAAGAPTGNTITVVNPPTAKIVSSTFAGSEPDVLAISDDSQFLYAGLDGSSSVQRFTLPSLSLDVNYALGANPTFGPYFGLDLQVAPGAPHTTAISLANFGVSPAAQGGIIIYDDITPRPTTAPGFSGTGNLFDSLQWGSNSTALYAANTEDTGFDFYTLTVSSTGVVLDKDFPSAFSGFFNRIHFDDGTKLIYSDDGHVIDPVTGLPAGSFSASGMMVPDSTLNTAFFLGQTQTQFGSANYTIELFNLTTFVPTNSVTVCCVSGSPVRLIRWGTNGLAFNTSGGQVFIVSGSFVNAMAATATPEDVEKLLANPVARTWQIPKTHLKPDSSTN